MCIFRQPVYIHLIQDLLLTTKKSNNQNSIHSSTFSKDQSRRLGLGPTYAVSLSLDKIYYNFLQQKSPAEKTRNKRTKKTFFNGWVWPQKTHARVCMYIPDFRVYLGKTAWTFWPSCTRKHILRSTLLYYCISCVNTSVTALLRLWDSLSKALPP